MRAFSGKYNTCLMRSSTDQDPSTTNVNTNGNSIQCTKGSITSCQSVRSCPLIQNDENMWLL